MRLIDADAIKLPKGFFEKVDNVPKFYEWLNEQPTIEERKTGRWIHDGYDHPHGIDWCHCSNCGNRESVDSVYTQADVYPYCARCGARMEVE